MRNLLAVTSLMVLAACNTTPKPEVIVQTNTVRVPVTVDPNIYKCPDPARPDPTWRRGELMEAFINLFTQYNTCKTSVDAAKAESERLKKQTQ